MVQPLAAKPYEGAQDIVMVAGVMRSGQTWLCYMLAHLLNARFLEPYCLLRGIVDTGNAYVLGLTQGHQPRRTSTDIDLVVKTHELPDPFFSLTKKVVLIVRDPRDVIASACARYDVMKRTGADIEMDAKNMLLTDAPLVKPPTFKDRVWNLVYGNRFMVVWLTARRWRNFHGAWRRIPFCHVVRYEDLLRNPVDTMTTLLGALNVPCDAEQLRDTVHKLSFKEISGRNAGVEDKNSIMFRKAAVGDHKKKFSSFELALIRRVCQDEASIHSYTL